MGKIAMDYVQRLDSARMHKPSTIKTKWRSWAQACSHSAVGQQ